jgi:hypothetical protein
MSHVIIILPQFGPAGAPRLKINILFSGNEVLKDKTDDIIDWYADPAGGEDTRLELSVSTL